MTIGPPVLSQVNPWLALVGTLLMSFGAVMAIRTLIERDAYLLRWSVFWVGDAIAIPIFAFFAAKSLAGYKEDPRLDRWFITGLLLLTGLALGMILWLGAMKTRGTTWEDFRIPSELYHTLVVLPIFVAMLGHAHISLLFNRPHPWSWTDAGWILGDMLFASCFAYDRFFVDGSATGR